MHNLCLFSVMVCFPTPLEVDCSCHLLLELVFIGVSSDNRPCSAGATHFLSNWRIRHFCASGSHEPVYDEVSDLMVNAVAMC